jgi:hypothetical protein
MLMALPRYLNKKFVLLLLLPQTQLGNYLLALEHARTVVQLGITLQKSQEM